MEAVKHEPQQTPEPFVGLILAFMPGFFEAFEVVLPPVIIAITQFVEVIPAIYSSIVVIVKRQFDCVVPDGFDRIDIDVLFAKLQYFLSRAMPLYLGRG